MLCSENKDYPGSAQFFFGIWQHLRAQEASSASKADRSGAISLAADSEARRSGVISLADDQIIALATMGATKGPPTAREH